MIVVLVLSLLFVPLLESSRRDADTAYDRGEKLKITAALDGALVSVSYDLSLAHPHIRLGIPDVMKIGSYSVSVTARPELSKLDINFATAKDIQSLLEMVGSTPEQAKELAENIVAWRRGYFGGGAKEDLSSNKNVIRPFETLADLALVRGGGEDLADCLVADVTVYTHSATTDISFASERVRLALTGSAEVHEHTLSSDSVVGGQAGRPDLYEIVEKAFDDGGKLVASRRSIIRSGRDLRRPLWIVSQNWTGANEVDINDACRRLAHHET
jgi:hypothetical protein